MNSNPPVPVATETAAPSTSASSSGSRSPSTLARLARRGVLLGLAFILTFFGCLALLAWTPLGESFAAGDPATFGMTLGYVALVPFALVALATRLRLDAWRWIGVGYLVVAPVLTYLAIDDPVLLHPTTLDEIAPAFPGAEKSYAVVMQYSKLTPSEEAKVFEKNSGRQQILGMPVNPDKRDDWIAFLKANRAKIEADWANLAPQRRWLAEVAAFDRLGDLGEASVDANIITFKVWRLLPQRSLHVAGLQVLDGQPDAAVATILPILQAGRKLQPSARSLVRLMVGIVVEKMNVLYVRDYLEPAGISAESRAKLAAALAGGVRGEAGARRLVGIDNAYAMGHYYDQPIGDILADFESYQKSTLKPGVQPLLNLISPFVYNSRRSVNLMGELNRELQDLAARRQTITGDAERLYREATRPRFKNFAGPIIADKATPAYSKIVRSYWELHDAREKLATRLAATP